MGAHESPASVLAAVETDAIRLRAARLVAQFNDDLAAPLGEKMTHADWAGWEGQAYSVLLEVARG